MKRISAGEFPEVTFEDVHDIARQYGVNDRYEDAHSFTGGVYVGKKSVVKIFSSAVTDDRLIVADAYAQGLQTHLDQYTASHPSFTPVRVQQYLRRDPENPESFITPFKGVRAVLLGKVPGEKLKQQTDKVLGRLATIQAITHSSAPNMPGVKAIANNLGQRHTCIEDYVEATMKPHGSEIEFPEGTKEIYYQANEVWGEFSQDVHHGDLWSNNALGTPENPGISIIDMNDAHEMPRIFCLAMALWGAYVNRQGDPSVLIKYMNQYAATAAEAGQPLTALEEKSWPLFTLVRAITSWHGARIVSKEVADADNVLIQKLRGEVINLASMYRS